MIPLWILLYFTAGLFFATCVDMAASDENRSNLGYGFLALIIVWPAGVLYVLVIAADMKFRKRLR